MGKELWTGRSVLKRFFREFFIRLIDENKESRPFLSFNKQSKEQVSDSPRIVVFQGENGLGKSSTISQCITIAEEIGAEFKKPVSTISINFEEIFLEKGQVPSNSKELINLIHTMISQKSPSIFEQFIEYKEFSDKIAKTSSHIKTLLRDEWPLELQTLLQTNDTDEQDFDKKYTAWIQKKLLKQDYEIFINGENHLKKIILNGLIETSKEIPILLCIDGYEYLTEPLSSWLRQEFIVPLYEQKNRIVTIVSGCEDISRSFRNDFSEELIFTFNFNNLTLTKQDISTIASILHCDLTDADIQQIEDYSAGIPLVVTDILNYLKSGFTCADLLSGSRNEIWNAPEIINDVVNRFLLNCKNETDRYRILSLAIMDQFDTDILAELWEINLADVLPTIAELSKQYPFISERQLHSTVRRYLRTYLMNECCKNDSEIKLLFDTYNIVCKNLINEQLDQLQKEFLTPDKKYSDERYTKAIINLIGSSVWNSPQEALMTFSGIFVELLYFNVDFASQLLWRMSEYHQIFHPHQISVIDMLHSALSYTSADLTKNRVPIDDQEIAIVEYLESCSECMSPFQQAILSKKRGELEFRMGHLMESMDLLKKSLDLMFDNTPDRLVLFDNFVQVGYAFKANQQLTESVAAFIYASHIRNECFLPHYEIGLSRILLNQYTEAIESLSEAVKINPDHQIAWYQLGLGYSSIQQYESAVDAFGKAIEKGPADQNIWFEMGKVLNKLNKHEDAVNAIEKVVASDSNHFEAWFIAGKSYTELGNSIEAISAFKKTLEIKPDQLEALVALAQVLYDQKSFEESANVIETAVELSENDSELWRILADAWFNAENYSKAINAGKKCVTLSPEHLQAWMILGNTFTAQKNYDEAIEAFLKAVEINPADPAIWNLIGENYYNINNFEKSIEAFTSAVNIDPRSCYSWFHIGLSFSAQQNYSEAAESFKKATDCEPDNADAWRQLGDMHMLLNQYTDAVECLSKAVTLQPQTHDHWYRKGLACLRINDFDAAILSLIKAAELCATDSDIWYHMGSAYASAGHLDEAIQAFKQSADLDPKRSDACYHMGLVKQELGLYQEAIESYNKTLELAPDQNDVWCRIGLCNYYLQLYPEAIDSLKKALFFDQENIEIIQHLGLSCHATGDFDAAIEYYRILTEKNPDLSESWFNMALALHSKGDFQSAIDAYKNVLSSFPDNADAWYNLGLAYHSNDEHYEAIKAYRQSAKINPDASEIWFHLGIAFHTVEQYGEAIQAYRKVVHLTPENSDAWFNLGLSYFIWGQYDDALEAYEKVIQLKPDHFEACGNISVTYYEINNYEKAIEFGLKAIELQNEAWLRTYLILSYVMLQNLEKANEQADILMSMNAPHDEITKAIRNLHIVMNKSSDQNSVQSLIDRLGSSCIEFSNV